MSQIPGVTVTKPVETKPAAQSKTVWSTIIALVIYLIGNFFPQVKEAITPELINGAVAFFAALAGIFLRKSVEDTKQVAAGAPVVKQ